MKKKTRCRNNLKRYSKKLRKNNKRRTFKKGGMFGWRMKKTNRVVPVEIPTVRTNQVVPFNPEIHNNLPFAETIPLAEATIDNSVKPPLNEVYDDIKKNGFSESINALLKLIDEYPDFDVNLKDVYGDTIADMILYECIKKYYQNNAIENDEEIETLVNKIINLKSYNSKTINSIVQKYHELANEYSKKIFLNNLLNKVYYTLTHSYIKKLLS